MTLRTRFWIVLAVIAALLASVGATPAQAHPLGNFTINRFSEIRAGLEQVRVLYVVDMAEIPTFQRRDRIDRNRDGDADEAELDAYVRTITPRLAGSLSLRSAGEDLPLRIESSRAELRPGQGSLDVLRIELELRAALRTERTTLVYADRNFAGRLGWKEVVARGTGGQGVERASVPSVSISDRLTSYPRDQLSSPPSVTEARVALAPDAPAIGDRAPSDLTEASIDFVGGWFPSLIQRELSLGFALAALGLALVAGALHALGPGHGKTIMAAYLVGADGRVRHAVMIGIAVSLMHTISVIALGLVTLWATNLFAPETVFPWLSLVSGAVVLALGLRLLMARLRALTRAREPGRPRGHGHSHGHGHEHAHGPPPGASPFSLPGLAAVALSGGLLPSPSALVVLLGAVALQRVAFGLLLVAAFSVGLAGALTGIGVLVLKTRALAARRLGARSGALIPVGSSALIVGVGIFLTARALVGL